MRRAAAYLLLAGALWAGPLNAQDDTPDPDTRADAETLAEEEAGGPLVRLLESLLSGENRNIQVVGLEGALSARATIERIVVSDDEGPWLTISGAVLDWNRLGLVRGRFSVNELSVDEIAVTRPPNPTETVDLPAPEAQPFALPELPVAVLIERIALDRVALGAALAGQEAALSVNGNLTLADGALDTGLLVDRLDRPGDRIALQASYSNETRQIGVDLRAEEEAGGLVGTLLNIPDAPPLTLTALGAGPVEDFSADLTLATDGVTRIGGSVNLQGQPATDAAPAGIGFGADLSGDVTALIDPQFHDFFGADTRLSVTGRRGDDGGVSVEALSLETAAVDLQGAFDLAADRQTVRAVLDGRIAPPGGAAVTLPLGSPATSIGGAQVSLQLDSAVSDDWTLALSVEDVNRPDLSLAAATVRGEGGIDLADGFSLTGTLDAELTGIDAADPDLRAALGDRITLTGGFGLPGDGTLTLEEMRLAGATFNTLLGASIDGLDSGFFLSASAELDLPDLAPFSGLAGRPLGGSLSAGLTGSGTPLAGSFDIALSGTAQDLATGIAELDPLLTGETRLSLEAGRGPDGVALRDLTLNGTALTAEISGQADSDGARLDLVAGLDDLGRVLPDISGPVRVEGAVRQDGADISADLDIDAPGGAQASLQAGLREGGQEGITLDLALSEPAGGPISALLRLPGRPSVALDIAGEGPVSDFDGTFTLATGGEERLGGTVGLARAEDPAGVALRADLSGDVTPLLPTEYHGFFGTQSDLQVTATRLDDGRIELEALTLDTRALRLTGSAALTAEGLPLHAQLTGTLRPAGTGAQTVRLPVPGDPLTLRAADIDLSLDADRDNRWRLALSTEGLSRPDATLERLSLRGNGALSLDGGLAASGQIAAAFDGVEMLDTGLQEAIGQTGRLSARFDLDRDGTLALSRVSLDAAGVVVTGDATVAGLDTAPTLDADLALRAGDLARFAALTGLDLQGSVSARLDATLDTRTRSFDGRLSAAAEDIRTGIPQADAVLAGRTTLALAATGSPDAVEIDRFDLEGRALSANASGRLARSDSDLRFSARLDDLGRVVPQAPGALALDGTVTQDGADWLADLRLEAPGSFADIDARLAPNGDADVTLDAEVGQLQRFLAELAGATATARGTATRRGDTVTAALDIGGPAGLRADIDASYDLAANTARGTAAGQLGLTVANQFLSPISVEGPLSFDLAIDGAPALSSLSGQLSTSNVSIAIPQIQNAVNNLSGAVRLNNGQAQVDFSGQMRTGGGFTIAGPVALEPPFAGQIDIAINQIVLTDDLSYDTVLNGGLSLAGPLTGGAELSGRIEVGETQINLAAAGGAGSVPIPDIEHVDEPTPVFLTRKRAGLVDTGNGNGGGSGAIALDIQIDAPGRIYVRGFGLNAELGGALAIRGDTANPAPSGEIDLIRGSMNVLGRNLSLDRGMVTLLGSLDPYLEFVASSTSQQGTAMMEIKGTLDDLELEISADPDRPEEEALAMLIFGNDFATLSPIRLAQMALYVAQLRSGRDPLSQATGADRASLSEDASGAAALGLGGYVSENVYTDATVNAQGDAELNINLDVTDNLTVRGTVNNEGETGFGLFFERDY